MATLPAKEQQIVEAHTGLIHRVVMACQNRERVPDLDDILKQAEQNGWLQLVAAIRQILKEDSCGRTRHIGAERTG